MYLDLEHEGYAISFENMRRLIDYFEYASPHRVALLLLALTGMRPSELDGLTTASFWRDMVIWSPRKNQHGYRKERLPERFLRELDQYIKTHHFVIRGQTDTPRRLFPFNAMALRRYITKYVRPALGGDFLKKRPVRLNGAVRLEYIIQVKSFRHTYACKSFYEALNRYGAELSIHMIAQNMKHSSTYMTARHYCSDVQYMKDELERYRGVDLGMILRDTGQTRLTMFS